MTPEVRAKVADGTRRRHERERGDAAAYAAKVESGKRLRAAFGSTPEMVAKQNAGRRASHWVPAGYEDLNARLRRKRVPLHERQALVLAEAAEDERKRLAAMTPFERQLERVRNGAALVTVHPRRSADLPYTAGGVATGML